MKLEYDRESDIAYVRLTDEQIVDSEEVRPGVVFDYDRRDRIVAIEIRSVRRERPDIDVSETEPKTV